MSQVKVFNTYGPVIAGCYIIPLHNVFGQTDEVGYLAPFFYYELLIIFTGQYLFIVLVF